MNITVRYAGVDKYELPIAEGQAARQAVLDALGDPGCRAAAERLRDEIAALPGPEHAVALLEQLARDREPLLATG